MWPDVISSDRRSRCRSDPQTGPKVEVCVGNTVCIVFQNMRVDVAFERWGNLVEEVVPSMKIEVRCREA